MSLLEFKDVNIIYKKKSEETHAVKDVSLNIQSGEIVGLVGESGVAKHLWKGSDRINTYFFRFNLLEGTSIHEAFQKKRNIKKKCR